MKNNVKKIRDIANVSSGYSLRTSVHQLQDGDIHMIQIKDVDIDTGIDWSDVASVDLPSKKEPKWLCKGDVLFTSRHVKNFAVTLGEDIPENLLCTPHFFVIRIQGTHMILPEFLAWQINQSPLQNYIKKFSQGSSAAFFGRDVLENMQITIPPLAVQKKIVEIYKLSLKEQAILQKLSTNIRQTMNAIAHNLITQ